jgi:hypothetical protein
VHLNSSEFFYHFKQQASNKKFSIVIGFSGSSSELVESFKYERSIKKIKKMFGFKYVKSIQNFLLKFNPLGLLLNKLKSTSTSIKIFNN